MVDFYLSENGEYYKVLPNGNIIKETGEMLFAISPPPEPETGNPVGLLLSLTYS